MKEKLLILRVINKNTNLSQRELAKLINVSVGKLNTLIKEMQDDRIINILGDKKGFRYEITKLGFAKLANDLKENVGRRVSIHNNKNNREIKECIILAAGNKTEFNKPASFLELEEKSVLDRQIQILRDNGIEKIYIVTGYKKEYYDTFAKEYQNIVCIHNENYKWTGSMASLALAKNYIRNDFLLIENDLVFENIAIEKVLKSENRDLILIVNESGSGDEAFVEIRNNLIYKMSKDIHQIGRIDGEMLGISKISKKFYDMMCEEFDMSINPYINYEYTMLDVARIYDLGYEKIPDLVWGEIDDKQQYDKIRKFIIPRIKRKELLGKIEQVKEIIARGLEVEVSKIEKIKAIGGMTNKNYSAKVDNKEYVIRIPGIGTSEMMDRISEGKNSSLVARIGIDANILYYDDKTGTKISAMIEGAETINAAMAKKPSVMKMTTDLLRTLHNSDIKMENTFDVFENINLYEDLVEKNDAIYFENYSEVREDVMCIKEVLEENGRCLVPSHNDTVPENFIKDKNGDLYLIDWEYGGLNDPMWDLAAHSLECSFTAEEEELLLKTYFGGGIKKQDKIRVLCYKILQDFLWSIWTIIKEAKGDNFGSYGIDRFNRCKDLLSVLKNEYILI
ncbi:MAG: NTP transferase domain-containing protein [Sarcina sp.]